MAFKASLSVLINSTSQYCLVICSLATSPFKGSITGRYYNKSMLHTICDASQESKVWNELITLVANPLYLPWRQCGWKLPTNPYHHFLWNISMNSWAALVALRLILCLNESISYAIRMQSRSIRVIFDSPLVSFSFLCVCDTTNSSILIFKNHLNAKRDKKQVFTKYEARVKVASLWLL